MDVNVGTFITIGTGMAAVLLMFLTFLLLSIVTTRVGVYLTLTRVIKLSKSTISYLPELLLLASIAYE